MTTIHYIVSKALDRNAAVRAIRHLLALFSVAPVDGRTLALAADLDFSDVERDFEPSLERPCWFAARG